MLLVLFAFQLVFAMQRVKAYSFFFFFFFTSKGINILWRGDGLVFLKCLLCYYCSKKEISSALSGGSHTSLGGQRDIVFPFLNSRHTARRKSQDISGLLRATCKLVAIIGSKPYSCCLSLNGCSQEKLLLSPVGKMPRSGCRLNKSEAISQALESLQLLFKLSKLLCNEKTWKTTSKTHPATQ